LSLGLLFLWNACSEEITSDFNSMDNPEYCEYVPLVSDQYKHDNPPFDISKVTATLTESFESGTKASYTTGDVTLSTGSWTFNDALIGNTTSDPKNGSQSARIRNTGKLTMKFDKSGGAATVTIKHAKYGTDGTSTWDLYYSTNAGTSWIKTGSTITTSTTSLATASFTVNKTGSIRFEIRKISGGTYRLNIDDVSITDYSGGGGGPTETEPNNSTSYANPLTLPATLTGYIGTSTDVDYFSFAATSGQIVTMGLTVPSSVDYDLYLKNSSGTTVAYSELGSGVTESISYTTTASGTFYAVVQTYSGYSTTASYTLTVSVSGGGGGTPTEHLMMGNPSNAVTNTSYPANYLMSKTQYAMSYHRDRGIPNWVSWHLDASWVGSAARQDDFRADATLPTGWYQVGGTSYSGSGFDRGHQCPSADRTNTVANNSATFLMTNMIPQAPDNNQGPWANLENYCRSLVDLGNELYIISGSYGTGGTGSSGSANTINGGKVTVPNRTWKVIVILTAGSGDDATRVTTSTRVIAVDMPNAQGIRSNSWGSYRTTVDAIETATGHDLLSRVSTTVQATIESRVDSGPTN
jgi:endonuclease G, mitochondrial